MSSKISLIQTGHVAVHPFQTEFMTLCVCGLSYFQQVSNVQELQDVSGPVTSQSAFVWYNRAMDFLCVQPAAVYNSVL